MRNRIKALAQKKWAKPAGAALLAIAIFGSGHDAGKAEEAVAQKPQGESGPTVEKMFTAPEKRWAEDSLPPEMYLWIGGLEAPEGDLRPVKGRFDGHRGCWMAIADTTLYMCPDGHYQYS